MKTLISQNKGGEKKTVDSYSNIGSSSQLFYKMKSVGNEYKFRSVEKQKLQITEMRQTRRQQRFLKNQGSHQQRQHHQHRSSSTLQYNYDRHDEELAKRRRQHEQTSSGSDNPRRLPQLIPLTSANELSDPRRERALYCNQFNVHFYGRIPPIMKNEQTPRFFQFLRAQLYHGLPDMRVTIIHQNETWEARHMEMIAESRRIEQEITKRRTLEFSKMEDIRHNINEQSRNKMDDIRHNLEEIDELEKSLSGAFNIMREDKDRCLAECRRQANLRYEDLLNEMDTIPPMDDEFTKLNINQNDNVGDSEEVIQLANNEEQGNITAAGQGSTENETEIGEPDKTPVFAPINLLESPIRVALVTGNGYMNSPDPNLQPVSPASDSDDYYFNQSSLEMLQEEYDPRAPYIPGTIDTGIELELLDDFQIEDL